MKNTSADHRINPDIEVLRAIAVTMTLIVHLDGLLFWGSDKLHGFQRVLFSGGGVDLFFCLSGYLITGNLLRDLKRNPYASLKSIAIPFWTRRIWRILPSAWAWLAIVLLLDLFFNRSNYFGTPLGNLKDAAAVVAQVSNFHFWACFNVKGYTCGVNQIYYSLSLEEQSYMAIPFLLFFLSRNKVLLVLGLVVLAQLLLPRPVLSILWYVRTDALALGAILALSRDSRIYQTMEPRFLSNGWAATAALSILVVALPLVQGLDASISFWNGIVSVICVVIVYIASFDKSYILPNSALKRVLVYLGSRSYAIYLIHIPAYRLTREIWARIVSDPSMIDGKYTFRFVVTAIALILVLSEINYRLIETPLRQYGVRVANRWRQSRTKARSAPVQQPI